MRILAGVIALICFLLLSVKYPLRKLGFHSLNSALMRLHEAASAGLLLFGLIHLILWFGIRKECGFLLALSGFSAFIMCFVIIAACHMMKDPAEKMRWHRILSLVTGVLIAVHGIAYWI